MNRLTPLESECQDILVAIRDIWTADPQRISRPLFMSLMGRVRDIMRKLENKEFGCDSGLHAGACECSKKRS